MSHLKQVSHWKDTLVSICNSMHIIPISKHTCIVAIDLMASYFLTSDLYNCRESFVYTVLYLLYTLISCQSLLVF